MEVDALVGSTLGQYEITDLLGKGGMATVYIARQAVINRTVAVKVLPRSFMHDGTFMQRFRREAEIVAGLEHFHILPIYDYGEHEGMPFIVMRYLDGGTVQDRIREGTLTWAEIISITKQIANALDYAHSRGVVHRDIKPSNILLDMQGNAYVADFGIAKVGEGTGDLTSTGIAGTPAYMAPEQPEAATPSPAMDVYALGVTLFEMLTGRLPYVADTPIGQILKHIREPVPSLLSVHPEMPQELDAALQRSMAKNPEARFQTAGQFARAFELAAAKAADLDLPTEGSTPYADTVQGIEPDAADTRLGGEPKHGTFILEKDRSVRTKPSAISLPVLIGGAVVLLLVAAGAITLLGGLLNGGNSETPTNPPIADVTATGQEVAVMSPQATETAVETATATSSPEPAITETPTPTATITNTPEPTVLPAQFIQRGTTMLLVGAGPFTMGNNGGYPNERPEHTVNLPAYYMDQSEVTNLYYKVCVDEGPCTPPITTDAPNIFGYYRNEAYNNYPVIYMTWFQAETYCKWRGGHLPTEAQWEKAARWDVVTQTARMFPWDNELLNQDYANMGNTGKTFEVGYFPRGNSPYGMYDMSGSVSEWVYDWYMSNYYEQVLPDNPIGPDTGEFKVYRGGSYEDTGSVLKTTFRRWATPAVSGPSVGFRCAYTPSGDPTPSTGE